MTMSQNALSSYRLLEYLWWHLIFFQPVAEARGFNRASGKGPAATMEVILNVSGSDLSKLVTIPLVNGFHINQM
jgi:hypothetical protein